MPESPTKSLYTLPRAGRLRGGKSFRYVWRHGIMLREGRLSLRSAFFSIALSAPSLKAAFLVRKKVLRRAAQRNRMRRLLREVYRHLRPEWEVRLKGAEAWLLWQWEEPRLPSQAELLPLMQKLFQRAYHTWERSSFF